MRRLGRFITKTTLALVISVLLALCSITLVTDHAGSLAEAKANCSVSCHSHGQNAVATNHTNKEEEDDKEPVPPAFAWPQIPVNLMLLYIMPVFGVLWFVSNKQKILLTTQLRF